MAKEMVVQISDCKLYAKLVGENDGPTVVMELDMEIFRRHGIQ